MRHARLTPDGLRYVAMAEGRRVPRPFHFRWLLPRLCGVGQTNWRAVQVATTVGLIPAGWWYGGFGWRGLFVGLSVVGLAGVWNVAWRFPVLVDAPAMCVALIAAAVLPTSVPAAVLVACVAGMMKESAPLFAALWAWSPWPLVALLFPALRACQRPGDDVLDAENAWILRHPWRASRKCHAGQWFDTQLWVAPWGALLAGVTATPQTIITLVAAYGQTLIATDTVRLYMWAWPVLAAGAADRIPTSWLLPVLLIHLANPAKGDGI